MPFPPSDVLARLLVALDVSLHIMYWHQYNVNLNGLTIYIYIYIYIFVRPSNMFDFIGFDKVKLAELNAYTPFFTFY